MSMMPGDAVIDRKRPEWGTGVVVSIGSTSVEVHFPEVGLKRLLMEVMVPSSEPAPPYSVKGRRVNPRPATAKSAAGSKAKARKPA